VRDYHRRKGLTLQETERWLAPALSYEPADFAGEGCACGEAHTVGAGTRE
jgi:hypothetical protein